jgi:hypothetical protein
MKRAQRDEQRATVQQAIAAAKAFILKQAEPFSVREVQDHVEYELTYEFEPVVFLNLVWQRTRDMLRQEGITLRVLRGQGRYTFADGVVAHQQAKQFNRKGINAIVRSVVSYGNALKDADPQEQNNIQRNMQAAQKLTGALVAIQSRKTKPEPALGSHTQGQGK